MIKVTEIKSLLSPLLLVKQEVPLIRDGVVTAEVIKINDKTDYKVGDKVLVLKGYLQELKINGDVILDTYYVSENNILGTI